jgi:hypothetical protein
MSNLDYWERKFEIKLAEIDSSRRQRAGAILSAIPSHAEWESFLEAVRSEWIYSDGYYSVRREHPGCFILLLGGVAFFEYDENRFWPQFAQAVGSKTFPANLQQEIADDFVLTAKKFGLKILQQEHRRDYVGSAVYHIGIPLSLWDGFLEICKWAWDNDWREMSDSEWCEVITKRAHTRPRLRNFLIDNRAAATEFIWEMHDARRILSKDASLSISELKQACLLRPEYFDEVPETARFLRPSDPDSLFRDRARLIWEENRSRISLCLPAVSQNKLPATWTVGQLRQAASATADILSLNSAAFTESLLLRLESGEQSEMQRLRGIAPFDLFDCERNKFVNLERETLPLASYALISQDVLSDLTRCGFDDDENPANERCELEDGTPYYITRLWPVAKSAEVSFSHSGQRKRIAFRSGLNIEARIFAGAGSYATNFSRYQEWIKVERLPLLCLAVPFGSFDEPESMVQRKFRVYVGGDATDGFWEERHEDEHQEFYVWRWCEEPQPRKKVSVSIKAPDLGIGFDYQVEMLQQKPRLADCWQSLPGEFLPWCLLAQPVVGMKEGMKWQDLLLAREAIAPDDPSSPSQLRYRLREYVNCGLLAYRGHVWTIAESRAKLESAEDGSAQMSYCGNPAILWALFRYLHDQLPALPLPPVEVVSRWGELPYLLVRWKPEQQRLAQKYLSNHYVRIVSDLWRH